MLTGQEKNLIILLLGNEQIIGVETMDQELRKAQEHHVGRIIHMLSHQLKRRGTMPEVEMGLTPMQKHVLTFILFETMERDLYQRDIEEEFRIRRSTASGILQLMEKKRIYLPQKCCEGCKAQTDYPYGKGRETQDGYSGKYSGDGKEADRRDSERGPGSVSSCSAENDLQSFGRRTDQMNNFRR